MFWTLIYPSSGACDCAVELPHPSFCSWFVVLEIWCGWVSVVSVWQTSNPPSGACDCAADLPHRAFCSRFVVCWRFGAAGFEWCVIIQQHSRRLLMMYILMSETC